MNKRVVQRENIELTMPINAAYVSAARLTASSIANRLGFNIEEIEDIKAAVSEACAYIIKKSALGNASSPTFKIIFVMQDRALEIRLSSDVLVIPDDEEEEISLQMMNALMDALTLETPNSTSLELFMKKHHKQNEFLSEGYASASSLI